MATVSGDQFDDFRLDRTQFSVVSLTDPDDALEYWLSRPVEERLRALECVRTANDLDIRVVPDLSFRI
jgi:hypothetical protein